jgi:hypothetical protein
VIVLQLYTSSFTVLGRAVNVFAVAGEEPIYISTFFIPADGEAGDRQETDVVAAA